MEKEILIQNAETLEREYEWFVQVLNTRMQLYFMNDCAYESIVEVPAPDLSGNETPYAEFVQHYNMQLSERLILLLALAPHFKPQVLDCFFAKNVQYDRGYSEFGGITGQQHGGFIPTGETALFLLAGDDLALRIQLLPIFDEAHYFFRHNILRLDTAPVREPALSGALVPSQEYLAYFTEAGAAYQPKYSAQFPAKRLSTPLNWDDLILDPQAYTELQEILAWLEHHETILGDWNLGRVIKPGYRALFYGPPGTGKTMTAALLGKSTDREVYRIDLSQVVSKYIGETEKNLAGIFDRAENSDWILFFDEADALFGKRTSTKDAKDRYANQEIAYLLQRIEDFPGVAILATNLKANIDDAFARRFQSMIYFPVPTIEQRMLLWEKTFSGAVPLSPDVKWAEIARQYEISGGGIINVLQYCALMAVRRDPPLITQADIVNGIKKELRKEGKSGT
jgi:AAA+ superfamily predicted ATPase